MSENPFAPPITESRTNSPAVPFASQGQRFLNFIIDNVILRFGAMTVGASGAAMVYGAGQVNEDSLVAFQLITMMIAFLFVLFYFIVLEFLTGRTIGKWITGTKVVSTDGSKPTSSQIITRTFCRMIPFEPFSFLFHRSESTGWHDTLSNTRVVRTR